jgi:hypothetical protein
MQFLRAEHKPAVPHGKVMVKVPCSWTQVTNKAVYSEVATLNNQILEVQFSGRREAIQFNQ